MNYKKDYSTRKLGFTIIESLVYIFLTTIILMEGINLFILMYESYIKSTKISIKYNDFQNFNINLDNIICEGELEKVIVEDGYILFLKDNKSNKLDKLIKSYNEEIFVKYLKSDVTETINTMLQDVDKFEVKKKGHLIYLIIYDKDGKEFIRCI